MYKFILLFSVISFSTCADFFPYRLKINENRKYIIATACGDIKLLCQGSMGVTQTLNIQPLSEDLTLNLLLLDSIFLNDNLNIYDIEFFLNKELLLKNKSEQIIEKEKVLSIKFRNKINFEDEDEPKKIRFLIPPGDYLLCNGKAVVKDTLWIGSW